MKKFPGKAVLSMAAQDGLLHRGVHQTGKIFFSGGRDVGADGRKPCHCKGYRVRRRKEGRLKKVMTVSDRTECGCETGGFMLT